MRTTLNLDPDLLSELMKVTRAKTKTEAIHRAMADLVRRKKLKGLKTLSGKVNISYIRPAQRQAERSRQTKHKQRLNDDR